ncbi:hypothetical protein F2Q69_00046005 [Brassica cretica]|uniref:Uncharacterized protein n=1 Tax=Brassica cretica TaxID=69181 RepID=A0A8S9Q2K6_BRACR|nr:hypothetical protein F2Q69_00046005 [Brassica cretica]
MVVISLHRHRPLWVPRIGGSTSTGFVGFRFWEAVALTAPFSPAFPGFRSMLLFSLRSIDSRFETPFKGLVCLRAEFGRALILWEMEEISTGSLGSWRGDFSGDSTVNAGGSGDESRSGEGGGVVKHVFLIGGDFSTPSSSALGSEDRWLRQHRIRRLSLPGSGGSDSTVFAGFSRWRRFRLGRWVRGAGFFSGDSTVNAGDSGDESRSGEGGDVVKHVFLIGEESNTCFGPVI